MRSSKKGILWLGVILVGITFLFSFGEVSDTSQVQFAWPPLVKQKYDERIAIFMNAQRTRCRNDLLKKAEGYVDSAIISEINFRLLDTVIFPDRPLKPSFPDNIRLNDSILAKPMIKFDEKD